MTDTPEAQRPDPGTQPDVGDGPASGAAATQATPGTATPAAPGADPSSPPTPGDATSGDPSASLPPRPDPFAPLPARIRTRWINPRRRWATALIAVGAAIALFAGGVAAGFGIAHGDGPDHVRSFGIIERGVPTPDHLPWSEQHRGPGAQHFPGHRQRPGSPGDHGRGDSGSAPSSSTGAGPTSSTGATSSGG